MRRRKNLRTARFMALLLHIGSAMRHGGGKSFQCTNRAGRKCEQSLVTECVGSRRVAKGRFPFTANHEDSINLEAVANVADVISDTAPMTQAPSDGGQC